MPISGYQYQRESFNDTSIYLSSPESEDVHSRSLEHSSSYAGKSLASLTPQREKLSTILEGKISNRARNRGLINRTTNPDISRVENSSSMLAKELTRGDARMDPRNHSKASSFIGESTIYAVYKIFVCTFIILIFIILVIRHLQEKICSKSIST